MDEAITLRVRDLSTSFFSEKGEIKAVDHVSFDVPHGSIVGLVGESGCGKSMTARSIMKLLKYPGKIVGGEILLEGRNLVPLSETEMSLIRGEEIAMIFQEPMTSLNPVFTIERQVSEPFIIHQGMSKKEAAKKAVEMLADVKIPNPENVAKQYPHQLSGGMRQRVMIAMALACKPKILIADEPTTALDVTIQAQILHLMNELQRENGTAIIFITHDLGVINEMADDVVVMYCGQVVEQASARTIFSQDCPASHPYTEGLMHSIPRMDNVGTKLKPIPGVVPHPLALPKGCKFAPRCKYATQRCLEEEPTLNEVFPGQRIRCFYPMKEVRCSEEHGKAVVNHKS